MKIIEEMDKSIKNMYEDMDLYYQYGGLLREIEMLQEHYKLTERYINKSDISDPNLYEFVELTTRVRAYLFAHKAPEEDLKKARIGINDLKMTILNRLVSRNLAQKNDALYNLVEKAGNMDFHDTKEELFDSFVDKKLAGVGEFLAKLQRIYRSNEEYLPYKYGNHEEYNNLEILMNLLSDNDENRIKVFESIKKWHEQPIYHDNVDDYSFSLEDKSVKSL